MRHVTAIRQRCDSCGRVTVHDVTTYYDDFGSDELIYCTECGK